MAVLPDPDRLSLWGQWMRENNEGISITKTALRAAVNAADDWAEANAAEYNAALPLPARTSLTAKQKARLLMFVIRRRFEIS